MAVHLAEPADIIDHIAVVGAGFSGSLTAINLVRHDGPRATLIDRHADAGTGLAFAAAHPAHLLNVRASNMSAFPDDPGHFIRWLETQGIGDAGNEFVPRLIYGDYLRTLVDAAAAEAPGRLAIVRGDVVDIVRTGGVEIALATGDRLHADAAVLAVGNLPPHAPQGVDADALPGVYIGDPWQDRAADGLGSDDVVLILGTGLTMIDIVLLLDSKGFEGRVVAMSRRGLLPHAHAAPGAPWTPMRERPRSVAAALVRGIRRRSGEIGWRAAIDELRPFTQDLWRAASLRQRARFMRHLRPWWDIHRHRLAPEVADRIAALHASGRLQVVAGKISGTTMRGNGATIAWRPRGETAFQKLAVRRVINCTGSQGDLTRVDDPLLARLVARGAIRPDACRLGIDVDEQMRAIDTAGRADDRLVAIGPMTRGAFWEIVAVPDIRTQAWTLARRFSHAQWAAEGL